MNANRSQVFSTGKVARMLGASVEAVNYWIRQGKLKAYRTPGGHYRIDAEDLRRFQSHHGTWLDPRVKLDRVPRILVVDDEPHIRDLVRDVLRDEYEVTTASAGLEAAMLVGEVKPDILIVDVRMPDVSGLDVVRLIKERYQGPMRVIVMTGYPYDPNAEKLRSMRIDGFLEKPFDLDELRRLVYSIDDDGRGGGPNYRPSLIQ